MQGLNFHLLKTLVILFFFFTILILFDLLVIMEENKVQLFTQKDTTYCGCFTTKEYNPVKDGEYVKNNEGCNKLLELENKEKELQVEKEKFDKERGNYVKKPENFEEMQEFYNEKENYIKKGEATFNDLTQEEQQKLTENAILQSKVDGTEITWKDLLQKFNYAFTINELKLRYLQAQPKFADIWKYYSGTQQLNSLKENEIPNGVDTIRTEDGKKIQLTSELIERMKKAEENDKPYLDLYDNTKEEENKLVNNINYDLSKINTYKVALVIPNALLNE